MRVGERVWVGVRVRMGVTSHKLGIEKFQRTVYHTCHALCLVNSWVLDLRVMVEGYG